VSVKREQRKIQTVGRFLRVYILYDLTPIIYVYNNKQTSVPPKNIVPEMCRNMLRHLLRERKRLIHLLHKNRVTD
jgi:hypothetical protein